MQEVQKATSPPLNSSAPVVTLALQDPKDVFGSASGAVATMAQPNAEPEEDYECVRVVFEPWIQPTNRALTWPLSIPAMRLSRPTSP